MKQPNRSLKQATGGVFNWRVFAAIVLAALVTLGCRSTDCAAHSPWGDAKETRAYQNARKRMEKNYPDDWNALAAYKTVAVIETIPHDACSTNMMQLAMWLRIAIGEGDRFLASLAALAVCTNYPNFSNSLLVCPTTGHVPGAISNAEAWTDYIYVGNGEEGGMCDVALLISPPENHGGEYGYVAWGCGNVGKLPAAAVRSLIKAPWCLPAESRGQLKVRSEGFDKFVKPAIKICIPARFASIYGTNSAAASRP